MSTQIAPPKQAGADRKELDQVVIRFAGDSGDGMQLTGDRFTSATAFFGNDLATLPDFPGRDPGSRRHDSGCRPSRSTSATTTS